MTGAWGFLFLAGEEVLVGEDAIEGGAADCELAGGSELVAAVEVEDELNVLANDGVEGEVGAGWGLRVEGRSGAGRRVGPGMGCGIDEGGGGERGVELRNRRRLEAVGQGEVGGTDDAVVGLKESIFENAGELAHVAGPSVLEEAGKGAGSEDDGALLIADADAVEEELGEGGDVFAALAQRRDRETNGGETKGEVGKKQSLTGHLAQRSLRRCEQNGAARRAVLKVFEDAEEQALAGRGEKVNAIEIGEAGKGGGIRVGSQPLAGVAALKGAGSEG